MIDILSKLENFKPIKDYCFGHTPMQISCFQTTAQKGSRKFEYWQHVLQLKGLYRTIKESELDLADIKRELLFWSNKWAFWRSRVKIPRLIWKVELVEQTIKEKSKEAERHLSIINEFYFDLITSTEDDILKEEADYWVSRLSRQMAFSNLAQKFHIPVGDMTAVMSLPDGVREAVFEKASDYIKNPAFLTSLKDKTPPKVLEAKKE
jgi:hypothetical protein